MGYEFSPSLMCMNLFDMKAQLAVLDQRAAYLHVDIMDGHFVKNITLSPMFIEQIRPHTKVPIDAHLMVEEPNDFIDMTIKAGADCITLHAETINGDAFRVISQIKAQNKSVGIILNPATPLDAIRHYIHLIDKLTILTVDPGFAGQAFITAMLDKIVEAKRIRAEKSLSYKIEIDGSCNEKTFARLIRAGADVFIVGSSGLFNLDLDLSAAWDKMMVAFRQCEQVAGA